MRRTAERETGGPRQSQSPAVGQADVIRPTTSGGRARCSIRAKRLPSVAVVALLAGACSSSSGRQHRQATQHRPSVAAAGCKVGVSWNNYAEERWAKWDEPAIKAALAAGGATYISKRRQSSSSETQATNVENLIHPGREGRHHPGAGMYRHQVLRHQPSAKASASSPTDRLNRRIRALLYITFDNRRSRPHAGSRHLRCQAQGQLRHHQGQTALTPTRTSSGAVSRRSSARQ